MDRKNRISCVGLIMTIAFASLILYYVTYIGLVKIAVDLPTADLRKSTATSGSGSEVKPHITEVPTSYPTGTPITIEIEVPVASATPQAAEPVAVNIPVTSTPEPTGPAVTIPDATPSEAQSYFAVIGRNGSKVVYEDCVLIGPIDEDISCEDAGILAKDCQITWTGNTPPKGMGVVVSNSDTCTPGSLPTR